MKSFAFGGNRGAEFLAAFIFANCMMAPPVQAKSGIYQGTIGIENSNAKIADSTKNCMANKNGTVCDQIPIKPPV